MMRLVNLWIEGCQTILERTQERSYVLLTKRDLKPVTGLVRMTGLNGVTAWFIVVLYF